MFKPKEDYIAMCRKHWSVFLVPGIWVLFLLLLGFSAENISTTLTFVVIAAIIALRSYISYQTDYLALTENKIIKHTGFIRSKEKSAPISKIQNIEVGNGLFGKLLNYNNIVIDNAGTGGREFSFTKAADATSFVALVQSKMT